MKTAIDPTRILLRSAVAWLLLVPLAGQALATTFLALTLLTVPATVLAAPYSFAPIVDDQGNFDPSSRIALNNHGQVAFRARKYGTGGNFVEGIYVGDGGPVATLYDSGGVFQEVGFPQINDQGTVVFSASLDAGGVGIFAGNGEPATTVANVWDQFSLNNAGVVAYRVNDSILTNDGGVIATVVDTSGPLKNGLALPAINDLGTVALSARLDSGGDGIFTVSGGSLQSIALNSATENDPDVFNFFNGFAINRSGAVVFQAGIENGGSAIFVGDGASVVTVADRTGVFSSFESPPGINDHGQVAFVAHLDAGGFGIFTGPTLPDKVVAMGDSLFGSTVNDLKFYGDFGGGLNDRGQIAFWCELANRRQVIVVATPLLPGDTNADGQVDLADLNNVRNNFGGAGLGDTNADGTVDLQDLNAVRNNFGAGGANPVPEPPSLVLLAAGTAGLAAYRRRRRIGD